MQHSPVAGFLIFMTYDEQLADTRWLIRRREILQRDDFCCQDCLISSKHVILHVHHREYKSGLMAWEYPDDMLITLCQFCHERMHGIRPDLRPDRLKPTFVYPAKFESQPIKHISQVFREFIELIQQQLNG